MTDPYAPGAEPGGAPPPPPGWGAGPSGYGGQGYGYPTQYGPPGRIRSTGLGMLLFVVTFGIYGWYWYYVTHDEMKRHTGDGLGGGIALLIAILAGVASPFISSHEVGRLYERAGRPQPVSAVTGLWVFPGIFLIVLPIVWFVKTNGALNEYWRAAGVR